MTEEEAIEILKENSCSMCAYGSQNMETCDIKGCDNRDAIKALEQKQPIDNCNNCFNGIAKGGCAIKELIKNKDCKYYMPTENQCAKDRK